MNYWRVTVKPESAFGTPLKGDTLFGQLCWAILNRYGQGRLQTLLDEYSKQPFAVCSDGFPKGYLPRPSLPVSFFSISQSEDRKVIKKKRWIPVDKLNIPISEWLRSAKSDNEMIADMDTKREMRHSPKKPGWENYENQPHNSINRLTGTTSRGMFAPYDQPQIWYQPGSSFDIYLLLDEAQLSLAEIKTLLCDIGVFGYGRDASIGLGKFKLTGCVEPEFEVAQHANACLTLAPCAPQGTGLDGQHGYYNIVTRFGRHGDVGVHGEHGPFKAPLLLADTAAVFSLTPQGQRYIGQALGGSGQLSRTIPATVHQGYAPFVPVYSPLHEQGEAA